MTSQHSYDATASTIDVTGLPEAAVRAVRVLVNELRAKTAPASLSCDEFERLLDEFSAGLPGKILPSDFSRADIYDDHD